MKLKKVFTYVVETIKTIGKLKSILILILNLFKNFIPLFIAYLLKEVVNLIIDGSDLKNFVTILISLLLVFISEYLIYFLLEIINYRINIIVENQIRKNNVEKLTKLEYENFEDPKTYQLFSISNSGSNIHPVEIVNRATNLITSIIMIIAYLSILIKYNVYLIILPILFIIIDNIIKRKNEKMYFDSNYNSNVFNLQKRTNYFGSLSNRAYYLENYIFNISLLFKDKLNENNKKLVVEKNKFLKIYLLLGIIEKVIYISVIYLNYLYIARNTFDGYISIADFTYYNSIILSLFSIASRIVDDYTFMAGHLRFKKMNDDFKNLTEKNITSNNKINTIEKHTIEFKNVSFKYPNSDEYVLKNVNFIINKNDTVAIIGRNGCGKTTIVKLLCGLYYVDSGEILIDGININNIGQDNISEVVNVMQQQIPKISISIKDYIANGNNIDEDLFIESIKQSGFYDDYIKNDFSYDTILGREFDDKGIELSTGQWQKVYLSKIIYNKKSINIMDEPTSSIDVRSENNFFTKINRIFNNQNIIFISHRLSVVHLCNKIIYFDDNNIICGNHEELLNKSKKYREEYQIQKNLYN